MHVGHDVVPREMITFIHGRVFAEGLTQHCFVKHNRAVVVQTIFLPRRASVFAGCLTRTSDTWENVQRHQTAVYEALQLIQPHLDSIDFTGSRNWVFFNQANGGTFKMMQKRKSLKHLITCPLDFAPRIRECDIEITSWNAWHHPKGYYKGKPADIWYGWDADRMKDVNRALHAARHLQGTELIQEVYGILMDDEDEVLGLVVEATRGRSVQGLKDLIPVSHAVSELERRRCVFRGIDMGCLLITGGKARFSDLRQIVIFSAGEQAEFDRLKDIDHWATLEKLWAELEDGGLAWMHFNFMGSRSAILFYSCAPERPIFPLATSFIFAGHTLLQLIGDDDEYNSIYRPMPCVSRTNIIRLLRVYEDLSGTPLELYDDSARLRIHSLKSTVRMAVQNSRIGRIPSQAVQRRARRNATTAPYIRGAQTRTAPTPVDYTYDSDCTSESGHSRLEEIF